MIVTALDFDFHNEVKDIGQIYSIFYHLSKHWQMHW